MSGSGAHYYYSTTTTSNASVWTNGPISSRSRLAVTRATPRRPRRRRTSPRVLTSPSIVRARRSTRSAGTMWTARLNLSATDTFVFTFSETMATTTVTTGTVDAALGLNNSHSFGASPTIAFTVTLGTAPTVTSGDTVDPTTAVKDAIGNADATPSPVTVTDNIAPSAPVGLAATSFAAFANINALGSRRFFPGPVTRPTARRRPARPAQHTPGCSRSIRP